MFKLSPLSKLVKLSLVTGLTLTAASTSVFAEEDDLVKNVERIAVVGSRAAPRSVNDSPVPIDIIGGDELGRNGATDMLDMLAATVPSFNVRAQPISDAATLIRPVNLRGLPSDSTLILLNGKRRHRASVIAFQGGGVNDGAQGPDISVIPSVALQQVEVLRDGAAAQYGSDAIAGVMNFVLKDASEGGSLSVKAGEYYEGDGTSTIIDGNIGLPLTENGFINASFQLKNADATSRSVQRPDAAGLIEAGNTYIEDPAQVWGNPEIKDDYTVFINTGIDLNDKTKVYAFGNVSSRDVTGGFYYRNPQNRGQVYAGLYRTVDGNLITQPKKNEFPILWKAWNDAPGTLLVGDSSGDMSGNCPLDLLVGDNVLSNPRYTSEVVNNPNCFSMNQLKPGGYTPLFTGSVDDMSFATGVKGEVSDWMYDVSFVTGNNKATFGLKNSLNPSMGLDSPTDFDTGAYEQSETTVGLDLVKAIDFGLANLVNVAAGLEWREESFEITQGENSSWVAGPYADQGFNIGSHGFKGFGPESSGKNSRNNIAAYLDLETFISDDFLFGTALRYEDFSSFGSTLDYKLTAQYQLNEELSVRGSHSTGFRAPTVGQANVVNTQTSIVNGDLIQTFIAPPTNPLAAFYGGKELEPEESTSFAFGAVYDNDGLLITVDYYTIEVTGRLAQSSQISVKSSDYAALEAVGVENPELISAVTYYSNDFDTKTQGIDLVANYDTEFFGADTMISLAYNWTDTEVTKRSLALDGNGDIALDDDGKQFFLTNDGKVRRLEDGIPAHRATLTFAPSWDKLNLTVRGNFYGEYYATHADDTSEWGSEVAGSAITLDAEVSYSVTDSLILSVGANNLLDQEAEKLKDAYAELGGIYYESGPFDYNGGYYYMKAQYKF